MKETKVYVDKMPDMCLNCPCLDGLYCNILCDKVFIGRETRDPKCKLQSIKDHDRELVKEVCEKIRENIEARNINELDIINRLAVFLDEIEKEFEK